MEFDKSRCYSAVNADELRTGDKVIPANCMADLKIWVQSNDNAREILLIHNDTNLARFEVKDSSGSFISALAYLVERKENCTNCVHRESERCKPNVSPINCCPCYDREIKQSYIEPRAEKKYRPFKNTDELIKVWEQKWSEKTNGQKWHDCKLNMPLIWVRDKNKYKTKLFITGYEPVKNLVTVYNDDYDMEDLFKYFEFLDGSPCGVGVEA